MNRSVYAYLRGEYKRPKRTPYKPIFSQFDIAGDRRPSTIKSGASLMSSKSVNRSRSTDKFEMKRMDISTRIKLLTTLK